MEFSNLPEQNNNVIVNLGPRRLPRRCNICGEIGYHDSRNCPMKNKDQAPLQSQDHFEVIQSSVDSAISNCMKKKEQAPYQSHEHFEVIKTSGDFGNSNECYQNVIQTIANSSSSPNHLTISQNVSNTNEEDFISFGQTFEEILVSENQEESYSSTQITSPSGTPYWIPYVPISIRPSLFAKYPSYHHVKSMYYYYAVQSGFDVRKTSVKKVNGVVTLRYFVCNREGDPNVSTQDTLDPKYRNNRRIDMHRQRCEASIRIRLIPESYEYEIYHFEERHNHSLYAKEISHLSRTRRQLDFMQKSFIFNMSSQNVGPTKAHRFYSGMKGGYANMGGNVCDFKNFARDLNKHVDRTDAKYLVGKMLDRKKHVPNFSFEYQCDNKKLTAMFWADETSKLHYHEFGDVVSFDATYRTNRYGMIFVPFTGIDNHKRCVTFGVGLLSKENVEYYVWLLQAFIKAFKNQPRLVLSDQDPAMRIAIEKVFHMSIHRLCLWHITSKLQIKVVSELFNNSNFKKRFNSLVWNSKLEETEFEEGWMNFLDEYNLKDIRWFSDMYRIRKNWAPAYFKYVSMSGLMRTTSRFESENSSFQTNTNPGTTLMMFMNAFENSMEKQRHNQSVLDFNDGQKYPRTSSLLTIEDHAAGIYTRTVFRQVQNEIRESIVSCQQISRNSQECNDVIIISEAKTNFQSSEHNISHEAIEDDFKLDKLYVDREYQVLFNRNEDKFSCTCLMFEQSGLLCRHIFCVFRSYKIKQIPSKYIMRRWKRGIIPIEMLTRTFRYGDQEDGIQFHAQEVYASVDNTLKVLFNDKSRIEEYLSCIKDLEKRFMCAPLDDPERSKAVEFDKFFGITHSIDIDIDNPSGIKTKGSGTRKRLRGFKEISMEKKAKEARKCAACNQLCHHDARNCPTKKKPTNQK